MKNKKNRAQRVKSKTKKLLILLNIIPFLFLFTSHACWAKKIRNKGKEIKLLNNFTTKKESSQSCSTYKDHPYYKNDKTIINKDVSLIVNQLISFMKKPDRLSIKNLFHPRLGITDQDIKHIIRSLETKNTGPLNISLFDAWLVNTGKNTQKIPCNTGNISIWPHYGYKKQIFVWLQVMGQKELSRVFFSIVTKDENYYIGSFHTSQWTHDGKNYKDWLKESSKSAKSSNLMQAYLQVDIARKIMSNTKLYLYNESENLNLLQKSILTKEKFHTNIQETIGKYDLAYVASIFVNKGIGLTIKIRDDEGRSPLLNQKVCKDIFKKINISSLGINLEGLRCSFINSNQKTERPSPQGSFLVKKIS
ncbi:MAG: hypothetical protein CMP11_01340 [Zetaproteobacteria bacterium]|nr:hypothetical protein [Pseudobdellovibrionaceae bacterium]